MLSQPIGRIGAWQPKSARSGRARWNAATKVLRAGAIGKVVAIQ